jgi:hypothetical protein
MESRGATARTKRGGFDMPISSSIRRLKHNGSRDSNPTGFSGDTSGCWESPSHCKSHADAGTQLVLAMGSGITQHVPAAGQKR